MPLNMSIDVTLDATNSAVFDRLQNGPFRLTLSILFSPKIRVSEPAGSVAGGRMSKNVYKDYNTRCRPGA